MAKYGASPANLGLIDLDPVEMMFWLYCPIKVPQEYTCTVPLNLSQFWPIIRVAEKACGINRWKDSYVYLTAKTLYVTADNPGNRPGWHSDGFMTDDLNFIWSDRNGTLFWTPEDWVEFTQDHTASLDEMEAVAEPDTDHHRIYDDKHLLMLDERVIHRVADVTTPGMRTFVKISVSRHRYNLKGNSINHSLGLDWDMAERSEQRNHPSKSLASLETRP